MHLTEIATPNATTKGEKLWNLKRSGKSSAVSADFFEKIIKKLSGFQNSSDIMSEQTTAQGGGEKNSKGKEEIMLDFIWDCIVEVFRNGDER
jgi:hypothetical protein